METIMKSILHNVVLLAPLVLLSSPAPAAKTFPAQPVTVIVPFAPGGSTDTVARIVSQALSQKLGQPVVIQNKAGANTRIGTDLAKRAVPDGYTLVLATNGHTSNAVMYKNITYDPIKDFTPVVYIGATPNVIAAHPGSGLNTLKALENTARAQPDKVFYATAGQGTIQHFTGAQLDEVAGTKMSHVAYKGGGPAALDVIAGQVPILISGLPNKGMVNGGNDVEFHSFLRLGETVKAHSILLEARLKQGREGGAMLITTSLNSYFTTSNRLLMRERQSIIYRNFQ
jgi:tripartite-type tricarboxylate transporter receptor subunit TctC